MQGWLWAGLALALLGWGGAGAEAEPTRATVRGDGILVVNDKPVFPIGIRTEQLHALDQIADAGFNLVLGSGEWTAEHYKKAHARGLLILGGHYDWATFASFRKGRGINLSLEEKEALQNVRENARDFAGRRPEETLELFDDLPGVIGWNTNEEPEAKLAEQVEYAYEVFKTQNPAHLVVSLVSGESARWLHLYDRSCDAMLVDVYPYLGGGARRGSVIESYTRVARAAEEIEGKPIWLMSQLIPPSYWSRNASDELNLKDLRLQHYLGLIGGANGVIMYEWRTLTEDFDGSGKIEAAPGAYERRWAAVGEMVKELHALAPLITDARLTEDLELRWISPGRDGPGVQVTRELDLYGQKFLLVANPLDVPVQAVVYGINAGNRDGFTAAVHLGGDDLAVDAGAAKAQGGAAIITVKPGGAGVFAFDRRPMEPLP